MFSLFRRLLVNNKGLALIEFAIFLPLFLVLFFGTVELARYIIIMQKVERTAFSISGIIVQYLPAQTPVVDEVNEISVANMDNNVFPQLSRIMGEYGNVADLRAIVTSVSKKDVNNIVINWQRASPNTSGKLNKSVVSIVNGLKPSAINKKVNGTVVKFNEEILDTLSTMQINENMIVVEVFYSYTPIVLNMLTVFGVPHIEAQTMISRVYTMPRYGSLLKLL